VPSFESWLYCLPVVSIDYLVQHHTFTAVDVIQCPRRLEGNDCDKIPGDQRSKYKNRGLGVR
jgi:hypothetical protein